MLVRALDLEGFPQLKAITRRNYLV